MISDFLTAHPITVMIVVTMVLITVYWLEHKFDQKITPKIEN